MPEEKVIIIGGGVGPMAGVKLHEHIIANTLTKGTDQDHLDIYHLSRSNGIADRTESLINGVPHIPAKGMFKTFQIADAALKKAGKSGVGGIPCNTFHAPEIFNYFTDLTVKTGLSIEILDMLKETGDFIGENFPEIDTLGLLSTTGTRKTGVYNKILKPLGFSIVQIDETLQSELHEAIYNRKWGIKAASRVVPHVRTKFENYVKKLVNSGAQGIILGCTEIPIVLPDKTLFNVPLIDPMLALARALIKNANPKKLKPILSIE